MVYGYGTWATFAKDDYTLTNFCLTGTCGLYFITFNMAHYMLAIKYSNISRQVPAKLGGQPYKPDTIWDHALFWFLVAFNILAGLGYSLSLVLFWNLVFLEKQSPPQWIRDLKIYSTFGSRLLAIISGVILVMGVIRIKNFFKQSGNQDYINTQMLLRHAAAFSLYLVGTTASSVSLLFVNLYPEIPAFFDIFSALYILDFLF